MARSGVRTFLLVMCCLGPLLAAPTQGAEIRAASHDWGPDGHLLVRLDLDMTPPDVLLDALANGIGVKFRVEVRLLERRFPFGERILSTAVQTARLEYYALSRHYVVTDLEREKILLGPTLGDGLELLAQRLGRVTLELHPESLRPDQRRYELLARVVLDYPALPMPLQWDARLRGAYMTQLGWHRWSFD